MTTKRSASPELFISNPFIKKRNLEWALSVPPQQSLQTSVGGREEEEAEAGAEAKAVEPTDDGTRDVAAAAAAAAPPPPSLPQSDPAAHFFAQLACSRLDPFPARSARLPGSEFRDLFERSLGSDRGAHFVVHQHDHPIAGTHYDLRLQINGRSSVSWAVMYGLPGDPNSSRLNRNATETRVHCLWNHVVETAGYGTGSLLVWDCGNYEVLPSLSRGGPGRGRGGWRRGPEVDPDSGGERDEDGDGYVDEVEAMTEQEKLAAAFGQRKIRVRLHGRKLPRGYVLNLRLTKGEDAEGRRKSARALERPARTRRTGRIGGPGTFEKRKKNKKKETVVETTSGSDSTFSEEEDEDGDVVPDPLSRPDVGIGDGEGPAEGVLTEMDREIRELEDEHVRRTNAYRGAENTVGSVYQRRWYLSLDREGSGFMRVRASVDGKGKTKKRVWALQDGEAGSGGGSSDCDGDGYKTEEVDESGRLVFPFYVRGPEVERSIVTGRLGAEVLRDEGVTGFVRRRGWRPVLN